MATQWFCRLMGSDLGPFTAREMVELVRQKRLTAEDLIRKGPVGDWVPAYVVQGLFDAAAQAPPAEAPTAPQRKVATGGKDPGAERTAPSTSLSGLLSSLLMGNLGQKSDTADKATTADSEVQVEVRRKDVEEPPVSVDVPLEDRRWFCIVQGERRGPMSYDALRRIASSGKLKPDDRVWSTSCPRWSKASDILDLVKS